MSENQDKKKEIQIYVFGGISILVIVGLYVATYFLLVGKEPNIRGTFGDMFGSINALFSGLALAGIIFTILLQRVELGYQREELRETRKEFQIQNQTLKLQRFENTFFQMLSIHHQIVNTIDKEEPRVIDLHPRNIQIMTLRGRDVFKVTRDDLLTTLDLANLEDLQDKYLEVYADVQTDFGHYFKNLYQILVLVDDIIMGYELDSDGAWMAEMQYKYISILRAQLSDYELAWLFYHGLCSIDDINYKEMVEKHGLLKNMPPTVLANSSHVDWYQPSAFEK